jgi:hypothetical protein
MKGRNILLILIIAFLLKKNLIGDVKCRANNLPP